MKKIIIAMAAIAAVFTMASCNKEQPVSPNENPTVGKSVITATIENDLTKVYLDANGNDIDGYKVFWSEGDNLFVGDYWEEDWFAEFTLENSSAGSSRGIFKWNKDEAYFHPIKRTDGTKYYEPIFETGKTYEAIFPFSFYYFNDDGFVEGNTWKTEQTYADMYIPMYGKAECTKDGEADFVFKNVGGLLRLTVKGTATISSITMQANEPISGDVCLIEDGEGNMLAEIVGGYPRMKNEIILDCGTNGVELKGDQGTDFYISIPSHHIYDKDFNLVVDGYTGVTITLTDMEGRTCEKKLNNKDGLVIERSKITTATFTASEFKTNVPEGALPGKFSVSADKQVYFSQGNLYYDGSKFNFETNQYEFQSSWSTSHVSYFYWSKDASIACVESYNESGTTGSDVFFTNETETTAKASFTVNLGGNERSGWRTLSTKEWQYLFNTSARMVNGKPCYSDAVSGVTIGGATYKGLFLYPDKYNGDVVSSSMSWNDINAAGIVFLPAAGGRYGSIVDSVGNYGLYWSSAADDEYGAYVVNFNGSNVDPDGIDGRGFGFSVRLITESK